MYGSDRHLPPKLIGAILITLLIVAVWLAQPVLGTAPASVPQARPTLPSEGAGSGNGSGNGTGLADLSCAGVRGTVINWGFQNEPGVTLRLEGDTYALSQISASDGRYDFRGLGNGYAILDPVLAEAQAGLRVHTSEAAVLLRCDQQAVLNVGVYSGDEPPQPPSHLRLTVDGTEANPGETISFNISARNDLPTPISNVSITDLFPTPFKILRAQSSRGRVDILDNRMLSLSVGDMESGEEVTITVDVQVNRWTPKGKEWENRTTLLYAESMADQVVSTITVGEGVSVGSPAVDRGTQPRPLAISDATIDQKAETVSALAAEEEDLPKPASADMNVTALSIDAAKTPEAPPIQAVMPTGQADMGETAVISPSLLVSGTLEVNGRLPVTGLGRNTVALPALGAGLLGIAVLAQILRRRSR